MARASKAGTTLAALMGFGVVLVAWQPAKQHHPGEHPGHAPPEHPSRAHGGHEASHETVSASGPAARIGGQVDDDDAFPEVAILSNGCTATPVARWNVSGVDTIRVVTAAHCLCQSLTPTGTDPTHPIFQQSAADCEARLAANGGSLAKRISVQFTHRSENHAAVQVLAYPANAQSIRIMPGFLASEIVPDGIHRAVLDNRVVDDLATLDVVPHVDHPGDAAWIQAIPLDTGTASAGAEYSIVGHGYNPSRPSGDAHDPGRPGIRRVLRVTAAHTPMPMPTPPSAPAVPPAWVGGGGPSAGAGLERGDSGSGLIRVDGSQHHYLAGVASYRTDDHSSYFVDLRQGGAAAFVNQGVPAHTP